MLGLFIMIFAELKQDGSMKKYIPYIVIVILAVALLFSVDRCSTIKDLSNSNLNAITDTVSYFKNKLGSQTASINTLQLDNEQLQNLVLHKDAGLAKLTKEFSKVNNIVKYKTIIQLDTIRIAYKDTVPCIFERSGELKADWYSFSYKSNQKGIQIDSLKTWTTSTIITGFKRKWLLGKQTAVTDITISNPHITVTEIKASEIVVPEPWYKKWHVWLAAGICGGWIAAQ